MKTLKCILYIFIFYIIILKGDSTILDKMYRIFFPWRTHNTTNSTNDSSELNIIIVKRDVISTIEKRSELGSRLLSDISTSNLKPCSDDQLMVYLAELQAINPESIINLSTMDELFLVCKQVSDSLEKMDGFLKTCSIPAGKDLYVQLIKGVDKLYDVLCEVDSDIQKGFKQNFPCLKTLHNDFETCFGPPDWTESNDKVEMCRIYKDIADCYYVKAAKVCGKKAAKVMKRVVQAVVDSIIPVHCSNIMSSPLVNDAMPDLDCAKNNRNICRELVILMVILNLIWYVQLIKIK